MPENSSPPFVTTVVSSPMKLVRRKTRRSCAWLIGVLESLATVGLEEADEADRWGGMFPF